MQGPEADALAAQLDDLVALVQTLSEADFARPSRCPGWSVAELVAHCEGILRRLVGENAEPVAGEAEIDRVGYYRYDPDGRRDGEASDKTFSEVVRDRVIAEVGGRTGAQLRAGLEAAVGAAVDGNAQVPADRVIHRAGHPRIAFGEFVASRNVEFGVHTMDIAHAVGRAEQPNPAAAPIITAVLDGLLEDRLPQSLDWDAATYILAGTGRRELSPHERDTLGVLASRFPLLR